MHNNLVKSQMLTALDSELSENLHQQYRVQPSGCFDSTLNVLNVLSGLERRGDLTEPLVSSSLR